MGRFLDRLFGRQKPDDKPPGDIAVAHAALGDEDFEHAAFHIGWALFQTPHRPELDSLVTRLVRLVEDPLSFVPEKPQMEGGEVALRAHLLARRGHLAAALSMVQALMSSDAPRPEFLGWASGWLDTDDALERLNPKDVYWLLAAYSERARIQGNNEANLDEIVPLARRLHQHFPTDDYLLFLASNVLRRGGHADEALAVAQSGHERHPTWQTAIGVALAQRDLGHLAKAATAYKAAAALDPEDITAFLDAGDMMTGAGRDTEALNAYEAALERQSGNAKARGAIAYLRYRETGDEAALHEIGEIAAEDPTGYVRGLGQRALLPYVGQLPEGAEATLNAFRRMADDPKLSEMESLRLNMTVNGPEAPSLLRAIDLEFEHQGRKLELDYQVTQAPSPHPLRIRGDVAYRLWNDDLPKPAPTLPPPPADLAESLADIAEENFAIEVWWHWAGELASELSESDIPQLLAVMTHPPKARRPEPMWDWLRRVQFAAALTIAQTGTDPWETSQRRQALTSLLAGPMDWTVEAAVTALGRLAVAQPKRRNEILHLLMDVVQHAPKEGHVPYLSALCIAAFEIPDVPEEIYELFETVWDSLFDDDE